MILLIHLPVKSRSLKVHGIFMFLLFYSYVTDVGPSDVATIPVITIDDSSPSNSFVSPDSVGQSNKGIRTVLLFCDHLYFI